MTATITLFSVDLVERDETVRSHVLAADAETVGVMHAAFQAIGIESPSHPYVRITPLHSQVPVLAGGAG